MSTNNYTSATEVSAEIKSRLQAISVEAGFNTDIGASVFAGKLAIEDGDVPCMSIIEGMDGVQMSPSKQIALALITQEYALVGYARCNPNDPNETAHKIIKDIKRAIFKNGDSTLGGKVRNVAYRGRNIGPRADGAPIVMALVEIQVVYPEDLTAP